ncbi:hypothetical protein P8452_03060 [Trifolium repens]|jgi:hypothetical protein|nr:hypothetical protein P8452_03060 [Trifolium repens]
MEQYQAKRAFGHSLFIKKGLKLKPLLSSPLLNYTSLPFSYDENLQPVITSIISSQESELFTAKPCNYDLFFMLSVLYPSTTLFFLLLPVA